MTETKADITAYECMMICVRDSKKIKKINVFREDERAYMFFLIGCMIQSMRHARQLLRDAGVREQFHVSYHVFDMEGQLIARKNGFGGHDYLRFKKYFGNIRSDDFNKSLRLVRKTGI